jgi:hypothetical protein
MCSNIPASPAYGVYISQLIRYARACSNYSDFLKRHLHGRNSANLELLIDKTSSIYLFVKLKVLANMRAKEHYWLMENTCEQIYHVWEGYFLQIPLPI